MRVRECADGVDRTIECSCREDGDELIGHTNMKQERRMSSIEHRRSSATCGVASKRAVEHTSFDRPMAGVGGPSRYDTDAARALAPPPTSLCVEPTPKPAPAVVIIVHVFVYRTLRDTQTLDVSKGHVTIHCTALLGRRASIERGRGWGCERAQRVRRALALWRVELP